MLEQIYKNARAIPREGDYTDDQGMCLCGKCGKPRECFIEYPTGSRKGIIKAIPCQCEIEKEERYLQRRSLEKLQDRVVELRKQGITDKAYTYHRFENDDGRNLDVTEKCKQYVKKWDIMRERCFGITFMGSVGGGKSFYACCIANALIDRGVKVLVTRLSDLVRNRVQNNDFVDLSDFDLIVLDDIGVEGATQTAYNIVDDIYRANIPLIVTTNLSLSQLKESTSIEKHRIYDRIIQRACIPVKVDVKISRLDIARQNAQDAYNILSEEV